MVTIDEEEFNSLLKDRKILRILEKYGVENWEGFAECGKEIAAL